MSLRNITIKIAVVGGALTFGIIMARGARANEDFDVKFKAIDTNGDGKISEAEFAAYSQAKFNKIDANGDGKVTAGEMDAMHQKMMRETKSEKTDTNPTQGANEKVKAMDMNGDGVLTADEYAAGTKTAFDAMDTNSDGYLTKAELKAGMSEMKKEMPKEKSSK